MTWTKDYIAAIIADLASENLFACRTLLQNLLQAPPLIPVVGMRLFRRPPRRAQ
jgi:hypothetical protein